MDLSIENFIFLKINEANRILFGGEGLFGCLVLMVFSVNGRVGEVFLNLIDKIFFEMGVY